MASFAGLFKSKTLTAPPAVMRRKLNLRNPDTWPFSLVMGLMFALFVVICTTGYIVLGVAQQQILDAQENKKADLQKTYNDKLKLAVNLEPIKKQKTLIQAELSDIEKQLPSKAELDALLKEINRIGEQNNLEFVYFRPGAVESGSNYLALPISLQLNGEYHKLAKFADQIAHLSRIVTLSDLKLSPLGRQTKTGSDLLQLVATARTYRYVEKAEAAK